MDWRSSGGRGGDTAASLIPFVSLSSDRKAHYSTLLLGTAHYIMYLYTLHTTNCTLHTANCICVSRYIKLLTTHSIVLANCVRSRNCPISCGLCAARCHRGRGVALYSAGGTVKCNTVQDLQSSAMFHSVILLQFSAVQWVQCSAVQRIQLSAVLWLQ